MACNGTKGWPHGSLLPSLLGIAKPPSTQPDTPDSASSTAVPFNLQALSLFVPVYPEAWSQSLSIHPSIIRDEGLSQNSRSMTDLSTIIQPAKSQISCIPHARIYYQLLLPWTRWRIEQIRLSRSVPSLPPASRTPVRFISAQNPFG